jgi:hypothetical protein
MIGLIRILTKEIATSPKGEAAIPDVILLFSFATGIYLRLGLLSPFVYFGLDLIFQSSRAEFILCEKSLAFLEKF